MDTREKIFPLERLNALLRDGEWTIAVGRFDPLTAAQAIRLKALKAQGRKLLAIVLENRDALLPGDARAALIAALRDVDAATVAEPERWRSEILANGRLHVVEDAEAEDARSADFVRYVVQRQAAASNGHCGS